MRFLYFILLSAVSASAQTFDSGWTKVPPTFKGLDGKTIVERIRDSPSLKAKNEFETTPEYLERISSASRIILGQELTAERVLVFRYSGDNPFDRITSMYDADTQRLKVNIKTSLLNKILTNAAGRMENKVFTGVGIATFERGPTSTYIGENAFGVKRKITKSEYTFYKLAINNIEDITQTKVSWIAPVSAEIEMPPARAKLVKANLEVIYVVKPVAPFHGFDAMQIKPTIDSPSDITTYTNFLIADVEEIWLIDGMSGEILSKMRKGIGWTPHLRAKPIPAKPTLPTILY